MDIKNTLVGVTLSATVCVGCLVFGEVFVRMVYPQQLAIMHVEEYLQPDSIVVWRNKKNARTTVNVGEGPQVFVTDEYGYRINASGDGERPPDAVEILTIGDSFLVGVSMRNEDTLAKQIERLLRDDAGIPAHVDNTGVDGWGVGQYYLESVAALQRSRYDVGIVFLYQANDISNRIRFEFDGPATIATREAHLPDTWTWKSFVDSTLYPIGERMDRMSHLYVLVKARAHALRAKLGLTRMVMPATLLTANRNSTMWDVTAKACKRIEEEFARHRTPVLFVLLPARYEAHDHLFREHLRVFDIPDESADIDQGRRKLMAAMEHEGLSVVDALPCLRNAAETTPGKEVYSPVYQHLNPRGARAVAECIMPLVESALASAGPTNATDE